MYIIKRLTHPNRSDDEEEIDGNVTSSQPSRHSRGQEGKGSRRRDEIETPSSQDEDEDPSSPPRRRVRRISKRTVVTSDEDEEDDTPRSREDVAANDENEDEASDGASTGRILRQTRSRTMGRGTSRDSRAQSDEEASRSRITKKKRSIDVRHMTGNKRVSF